jgi:hypothetical protein
VAEETVRKRMFTILPATLTIFYSTTDEQGEV